MTQSPIKDMLRQEKFPKGKINNISYISLCKFSCWIFTGKKNKFSSIYIVLWANMIINFNPAKKSFKNILKIKETQ